MVRKWTASRDLNPRKRGAKVRKRQTSSLLIKCSVKKLWVSGDKWNWKLRLSTDNMPASITLLSRRSLSRWDS